MNREENNEPRLFDEEIIRIAAIIEKTKKDFNGCNAEVKLSWTNMIKDKEIVMSIKVKDTEEDDE